MAYFRKLAGVDQAGFDASRYMQVLPLGRSSRVYLMGGDGMDVVIDDESIAQAEVRTDNPSSHPGSPVSDWEAAQTIREVKLKGIALGKTRLRATLGGNDWSNPLDVVVVSDPDSRRVGQSAVSPDMRQAVQSVSLRQAVIMIAEDQMNSAISQTSGFGRYDCDPAYDWCGAFAHWCWKQAAEIQRCDNPFGSDNDKLLSPQKAISWAMEESTPAQLLRYRGPDPFKGGKAIQEFREIGYNGYDLNIADIVLLREGHAGGWKHVCMVYSYAGGSLTTIDGNQWPQKIKTVGRDINETLSDASYKLVFVHPIL